MCLCRIVPKMKKPLIILLLLCLIMGCTVPRETPEDVLPYYELKDGVVSWSGIQLGIDTIDIAKEKLLASDHAQNPKPYIKEIEYLMDGGEGLMFSNSNGYNFMRVVKSSTDTLVVIGIYFVGLFPSEAVFESIAPPEKVLIMVGIQGLGDRQIVLYNREYGYVLHGGDNVRDFENLTYTLDENEGYVLYIFSPMYFDMFLEIATDGYGPDNIPEEFYQDWAGYTEYEVFQP